MSENPGYEKLAEAILDGVNDEKPETSLETGVNATAIAGVASVGVDAVARVIGIGVSAKTQG